MLDMNGSDERFDRLEALIRSEAAETREYVDLRFGEARRHFDVLADDLREKIGYLAEGCDSLRSDVTELKGGVARLEVGQERLEVRQSALEYRQGRLEDRQGRLEQGQERLEDRQTGLEAHQGALEGQVKELTTEVRLSVARKH
jgi:chromosome segregation ATPase